MSRSPATAADCCFTATPGFTLLLLDEEMVARRRGRCRGRAPRRGRRLVPARQARSARHPRLVHGRIRPDAPTAEAEGARRRLADVRPRRPAAGRRGPPPAPPPPFPPPGGPLPP